MMMILMISNLLKFDWLSFQSFRCCLNVFIFLQIQTYFEKMKPAYEADAQQKKFPFQLQNMRLGAVYSLFDGEELLEQSIRSISSQVERLTLSCPKIGLILMTVCNQSKYCRWIS